MSTKWVEGKLVGNVSQMGVLVQIRIYFDRVQMNLLLIRLLSGRDAGELKGCLVRLSVVAGGAWHRTNILDSKANAPPELSINSQSQIVDKEE